MSCINLMPPWFITATLVWLVAALPIPPDGPGWVEIRAGDRCPLLEVVLSFRWWQPQPLLCTMFPQTFLFIPLPFKPWIWAQLNPLPACSHGAPRTLHVCMCRQHSQNAATPCGVVLVMTDAWPRDGGVSCPSACSCSGGALLLESFL